MIQISEKQIFENEALELCYEGTAFPVFKIDWDDEEWVYSSAWPIYAIEEADSPCYNWESTLSSYFSNERCSRSQALSLINTVSSAYSINPPRLRVTSNLKQRKAGHYTVTDEGPLITIKPDSLLRKVVLHETGHHIDHEFLNGSGHSISFVASIIELYSSFADVPFKVAHDSALGFGVFGYKPLLKALLSGSSDTVLRAMLLNLYVSPSRYSEKYHFYEMAWHNFLQIIYEEHVRFNSTEDIINDLSHWLERLERFYYKAFDNEDIVKININSYYRLAIKIAMKSLKSQALSQKDSV